MGSCVCFVGVVGAVGEKAVTALAVASMRGFQHLTKQKPHKTVCFCHAPGRQQGEGGGCSGRSFFLTNIQPFPSLSSFSGRQQGEGGGCCCGGL